MWTRTMRSTCTVHTGGSACWTCNAFSFSVLAFFRSNLKRARGVWYELR